MQHLKPYILKFAGPLWSILILDFVPAVMCINYCKKSRLALIELFVLDLDDMAKKICFTAVIST